MLGRKEEVLGDRETEYPFKSKKELEERSPVKGGRVPKSWRPSGLRGGIP